MKIILILSFASMGLFGSSVASTMEGPPPEIIEKAKQLALKKDYPAVLKMMAEIDERFKDVHNADYFYSLRALTRGMSEARLQTGGGLANYEGAWAARKVTWKIFLTRCNEPKDAPAVWKMKQFAADGGFSCLGYQAYQDRDQFVALREDAVALLYTYIKSLRAEIISGYHQKPDRWATGAISYDGTPPPPTPEEIAEKKQREAEFAVNAIANATQRELNECLYQFKHAVVSLVENDFSFPPEDDQTASDLLNEMNEIPPRSNDQERILRDMALDRLRHAAELERMRRSRSTPAPPQPAGQ